jgi:signal transduction histidine kinase
MTLACNWLPARTGSLEGWLTRGIRVGIASMSLEHALSELWDEFTPDGACYKIFVLGKPKALKPAIKEQIYLIGREAVLNAVRHSGAAAIEAEVEYSARRLRVVVRDNGCGMDPQVVRSSWHSHWGLLRMRERAESVGAQLRIWSGLGGGTEVEISCSNPYC